MLARVKRVGGTRAETLEKIRKARVQDFGKGSQQASIWIVFGNAELLAGKEGLVFGFAILWHLIVRTWTR